MRLAIAPRSTVRSRFKVLDYFIISSEKLKRGSTLTTSQYTIAHTVYFKPQRTVIENTKLVVQHYRHTANSASSWALTCNWLNEYIRKRKNAYNTVPSMCRITLTDWIMYTCIRLPAMFKHDDKDKNWVLSVSPSLISLVVSVDVKHHVYLLISFPSLVKRQGHIRATGISSH